MEWRDRALVLGVRRHGETSVVAELMTRERGRHLGLVRGGRSRRQQPVLQPGNEVEATWRARLDEHLGTLTLEPVTLRAAQLMSDPLALHAVQLLAAHLRLLAEREPHARLYEALRFLLEEMGDARVAGEGILRFEAALLEELGFGLDLESCALTGAREGLAYVSPRTGRAVTAAAGEPWKDKLLPLSSVLAGRGGAVEARDLAAGYRVTGHFLARHFWEPRAMEEPGPRHAFLAELARRLAREGAEALERGAAND
ncbi:DNA repair protein RecO [Aureimonas populi]|uniref:DNA repair protein RecO n=1 Tax=Aureimonas populi TaxID=1701758 RepID=A0ABW5CIH3_9HYPH|nr:DNA repair protein RecO [Aureimonas populi]